MFLNQLTDLEKNPLGSRGDLAEYDLAPFRQFLATIGNPQSGLNFLHIAGTKGKGSTAAIAEALLRNIGFPTATFTSPHLAHYGERFRINGIPWTQQQFEAALERFSASLPESTRSQFTAGSYRTVFEVLTALALVEFRASALAAKSTHQLPQIIIWETGLGGRLDCTNVVDPLVSVITTLGIDHVNILGGTIEKIAAEKAGIIKPHRPVVVSRQATEWESRVLPVIQNIAAENQAPIVRAWEKNPVTDSTPATGGQRITVSLPGSPPRETFIPLRGQFQHPNIEAAIAAATIIARHFGQHPDADALLHGLPRVDWPGRFEILETQSAKLILDGAHCPLSAAVLGRAVALEIAAPFILLFGMQQDKNHAEFLRKLVDASAPAVPAAIFCYTVPGQRGAAAETLAAAAAPFGIPVRAFDSAPAALNAALQQPLPIVAAGTLYSISELHTQWNATHGIQDHAPE